MGKKTIPMDNHKVHIHKETVTEEEKFHQHCIGLCKGQEGYEGKVQVTFYPIKGGNQMFSITQVDCQVIEAKEEVMGL